MAEKITKKELKEPDRLQIAFWNLVDYASKNRKKVIVSLIIFLSVFAAGSSWFIYQDRYEKKAQEKYRQAYDLDLKGGESGGEQAVKAYLELTSEYSRSKVARIAYLRLGGLYYEQGKYDESISFYEKFLKMSLRDPILISLANFGLGYAYEAKGDYTNALKSFEKAMSVSPGDHFAVLGNRNMGRVYEQLQDIPKSREHYRKALEKAKDPSQELFLKRKIAELG